MRSINSLNPREEATVKKFKFPLWEKESRETTPKPGRRRRENGIINLIDILSSLSFFFEEKKKKIYRTKKKNNF